LRGRVVASRCPTAASLGRCCNALANICEERAWYAMASDLFGEAILALEDSGVATELLGTLLAQRGWHELRLGRAGEAASLARRALGLFADQDRSSAWRTAALTLA